MLDDMSEKTETPEQREERHTRLGWYTSELALEIGVDPSRIRQLLIDDKQLHGFKFGKMWVITDKEAKRFIAEYREQKES